MRKKRKPKKKNQIKRKKVKYMIILTLLHFAEDEKKAEKEELVEVSLEELQKQEENPKIKGKNEAKGNNKYYF